VAQNHPLQKYFLEDPLTHWSFTSPGLFRRRAAARLHLLRPARGRERGERLGDRQGALQPHPNVPSCRCGPRTARSPDPPSRRGAAKNDPKPSPGRIAAAFGEANRSVALRGRPQAWVAPTRTRRRWTDRADFHGTAVEAIDVGADVLPRGHKLGKFDLIYASGLYDYLQHNVAVKLTKTCLQMLKRTAHSCSPTTPRAHPMPATGTFMDWVLLLRSESTCGTSSTPASTARRRGAVYLARTAMCCTRVEAGGRRQANGLGSVDLLATGDLRRLGEWPLGPHVGHKAQFWLS